MTLTTSSSGQAERGAQFDHQRLLGGRQGDGEAFGEVRAVGNAVAILPNSGR